LFIRAVFLILVTLFSAAGAPSDSPIAGRWLARSPDPVGRTESIELRFTPSDAGYTGVLQIPDSEIPLVKIVLQGNRLTFDATRELRNRKVLYHYDGTLAGDSIDFTVQNEDGSSFFRFAAHRAQ